MTYFLLSYGETPEVARAGLRINGRIYDAAVATGEASYVGVLDVLRDWEKASGLCEMAAQKIGAAEGGPFEPLASAALQAPVLYPGQIFASGVNYRDHLTEMLHSDSARLGPNPKSSGGKPWHYIKTSHSVVGPEGSTTIPIYTQMLDWEIELTAVIGKKARNVRLDDALSYVAGYTIANDLSCRDSWRRENTDFASPFSIDWIASKGFEGACPLGPWIAPASQLPDPQSLQIKLWVGDELMQDANTEQMVYSVAEQITLLSTRLTLHPGDLIMTGSPSGVGMGRGRFLQKGEKLRLEIEGIGELRHEIR